MSKKVRVFKEFGVKCGSNVGYINAMEDALDYAGYFGGIITKVSSQRMIDVGGEEDFMALVITYEADKERWDEYRKRGLSE